MRIYLSIWMMLMAMEVHTQSRPIILLEDHNEQSFDIKCYCKPGVRNRSRAKGLYFRYQYLGSGLIEAPDGEFDTPLPEYSKFRKIAGGISLPLLRKERLRLILGAKYSAEQFELKTVGSDFQQLVQGLDNLSLKSTSLNISSVYSLNERQYIGFRISTSYKGGYEGLINFDSRYAVYNGGIAFGIKKSEDNEWGVGLAGSRNFRNQNFRVLPFLFWDRTINDHWGYQLTFPTSYKLRYNIDNESILLLNLSYNAESYSYDQELTDIREIAYNHSEVFFDIRLEKQIIPWLWLDVNIGYHFNFHSSFELQNTRENILEIDPGNSINLQIGFFISPPDKFL